MTFSNMELRGSPCFGNSRFCGILSCSLDVEGIHVKCVAPIFCKLKSLAKLPGKGVAKLLGPIVKGPQLLVFREAQEYNFWRAGKKKVEHQNSAVNSENPRPWVFALQSK
jgi:hypothetical protein